MFKELIRGLFGYTYILNLRTAEVHDTNNEHRNCHLSSIKDKRYITKRRFLRLKKAKLADGCAFCLKEYNEG